MRNQFALPNRQSWRAQPLAETALASNLTWSMLEAFQLRQLAAATYSQLIAQLGADEALIARVGVYILGRFYPQEHEIACWIGHGGIYNQLIHGQGAGNREIKGYYAVSKDRLLSLLFA